MVCLIGKHNRPHTGLSELSASHMSTPSCLCSVRFSDIRLSDWTITIKSSFWVVRLSVLCFTREHTILSLFCQVFGYRTVLSNWPITRLLKSGFRVFRFSVLYSLVPNSCVKMSDCLCQTGRLPFFSFFLLYCQIDSTHTKEHSYLIFLSDYTGSVRFQSVRLTSCQFISCVTLSGYLIVSTVCLHTKSALLFNLHRLSIFKLSEMCVHTQAYIYANMELPELCGRLQAHSCPHTGLSEFHNFKLTNCQYRNCVYIH